LQKSRWTPKHSPIPDDASTQRDGTFDEIVSLQHWLERDGIMERFATCHRLTLAATAWKALSQRRHQLLCRINASLRCSRQPHHCDNA
jgi:hypothetical protein